MLYLDYAGFAVGSLALIATYLVYRRNRHLRRALDAQGVRFDAQSARHEQKLKERELWHWQMQREMLASLLESFVLGPVPTLEDLALHTKADWQLTSSNKR
jgi:hypothetical protein